MKKIQNHNIILIIAQHLFNCLNNKIVKMLRFTNNLIFKLSKYTRTNINSHLSDSKGFRLKYGFSK